MRDKNYPLVVGGGGCGDGGVGRHHCVVVVVLLTLNRVRMLLVCWRELVANMLWQKSHI